MPTEASDDVAIKPENVGSPTASETVAADANKDAASAETKDEQIPSRYQPLFREPLSNHPIEEKLAAMRAAIEAGADVNQLDNDPIVGYNLGRPLDACVRHWFIKNIPATELLLQHGADPRLNARPTLFSPLRTMTYHAENGPTEENRAACKRILAMFEEAILRLDGERKNEAGAEQA